MLLRTRIALMVSLSSVVLALILFAEGRIREHWADERYQATLVAGDGNAWAGVRDGALDRLEAYAGQALQDERVPGAVAEQDAEVLSRALTEVLVRMRAARVQAQMEVVSPNGALRFSSVGAEQPRIDAGLVAEVLRRGTPVRGLVRTLQGDLAMAVVAPIYSRTGPSGVLSLLSDTERLVNETALATSATVFLANPSGALLAGSVPEGYPLLNLPEDEESGVRAGKAEGKVFTVAWVGLADALGRPAGRLVTMRDVTASSRRAALVSALSLGGLMSGGLLFLAFLYWYMRHAFTPLNGVIRVLNALSRGDTSVPLVTTPRRDEIGRLAGTVENFRQAQQARDALARISQDLNAASRLQRSILPRDFPSTADYELSALMRPASDVGGDFYDFFNLPDGRLGFIMADVSGKGMAAALFMAMARTVIRSVARLTDDPGVCLERANELLCGSNIEDGTFVTVFYGILDTATGNVTFANGGHNPPYHIRRRGRVAALPGTHGVALGVLDGLDYATDRITLRPGDTLFLYTDGITEAVSPDEELFGEERLEEALSRCAGAEMPAVVADVVGAVDAFAASASQADDITCLALRFQPSKMLGSRHHGEARPASAH